MARALAMLAELASGEQENGSGLVYSTGSGSSPPPPPPDTTLDELTTWVIVVIGVCVLIFLIFGALWVAEGDAQPRRKRGKWLVWNGEWYRMQNRNTTVLERVDQQKAAGAPIVSVRKPGEDQRPLICSKK